MQIVECVGILQMYVLWLLVKLLVWLWDQLEQLLGLFDFGEYCVLGDGCVCFDCQFGDGVIFMCGDWVFYFYCFEDYYQVVGYDFLFFFDCEFNYGVLYRCGYCVIGGCCVGVCILFVWFGFVLDDIDWVVIVVIGQCEISWQ